MEALEVSWENKCYADSMIRYIEGRNVQPIKSNLNEASMLEYL